MTSSCYKRLLNLCWPETTTVMWQEFLVGLNLQCKAHDMVNPSGGHQHVAYIQWAHGVKITSLICQNDVATSFWSNNYDVMIMSCVHMMTSSNGNIFHVTDHLCGEFTGHRWIHRPKASDEDLWCFLDLRMNKRLNKQSWGWWFETPSRSLWRHCNGDVCSAGMGCFSHSRSLTIHHRNAVNLRFSSR